MTSSLLPLFKSLKLYIPDLWSARAHSTSFRNTRSGYLRSRITMLSSVWGILVILWLPFDLMLLADPVNHQIAASRLLLGGVLLGIAWKNHQHTTLKRAQWYMGLMVGSINLFYLYTAWVLDFPTVYSGFVYGYTLLPIVHVAILTILPVTLKESLCMLAVTAITQLLVDSLAGHLLNPENIASYWLQNVLALMVVWSQLSKLHMLMRLYRQATLDPLTGVYNRRMLLQLADKYLASCAQKGQPFSVLLFDIDRFKRINDTWGHGVGDKVLKEFAHFMQQQIRKTDLFGRFGGEEFILFLPQCTSCDAERMAERMLSRIRALEIETGIDNTAINFTASIGISNYASGDSLSSIIERADRALYDCKDAGRDCTRFHPIGYRPILSERRKAIA
ncbi:GGDEF domain-containing protein [Photobacterium sp. DA100]|uniref:GGDEF domain-containing protein n=1 Tax=Photobacterium sp. DA100 TaxID=3027472 RepID=UPI00247A8BD8|nr:GGDEF domain-containing protein [Photobacterium sp. DA100]WEM43476.1 GGDEF domain-containing protein [Photobacterium sp. DA100]